MYDKPTQESLAKKSLLTGLALFCFAGNSLLCRAALSDPASDAVLFTLIRLASGAVALFLLRGLVGRKQSVPVLASAGAVLLLDETLTLRFVVAGITVLSGVTLAFLRR